MCGGTKDSIQQSGQVKSESRDEVIPRCEPEVAMEKEEKQEEYDSKVVCSLEEFIETIADWANRHYIEPCLRDESRYSGPVHHRCPPLQHHVAFLDVHDNEREGMDEGEDEHCPANPAMEDLELFVRDTGQDCDPIYFRRRDPRLS